MSMWGVFRRRPVLPQPSQSAAALATLSAGIQTFPMLADAGAFTIAGQDIGPRISLTCEPASFAIAGQDNNYIAAQGLIADSAAFVLTANDASLPQAFVCEVGAFAIGGQPTLIAGQLTAEVASFTLDGQAALFAGSLAAGAASFTIAGQAALFADRLTAEAAAFALGAQDALFADRLTSSAASFALSGQAALFAGQMVAEAASFTLSGQVVGQLWPAAAAAFTLAGQALTYQTTIALAAGAFTLSAQAIGQRWAADAAAFTLSGQDALLRTAIGLIAGTGSFVLTANNVYSVYSPDNPAEGAVAEYGVAEFPGASGISIATAAAAFTLAGQALAFRPALVIEAGTFTLSGGAANQSWTAQAAAFALAGQPALFTGSLAISAGSFVLAGQPIGQAWLASPGSFVLTGIDVVFTEGRTAETAAFVITPVAISFIDLQAASFTISGQPIAGTFSLPCAAAAYTLTGQEVTFLNNLLFDVQAGDFTLAGQDIGFGRSVGAEPAAFVLSGQQTADVIRLLCDAASFAITGQALAFNVAFRLATGQFILRGMSVIDALGPSGDHIFLIEVQAHDGDEVLTFYLGTEGFLDGSNFYIPRVMDPGNFSQSISLPGEGESTASAGDVVIANGDPGNGETLDSWIPLGFGDRAITIRALPVGSKSLNAARTLFLGRVGKLRSTNPLEQLELTISNKLTVLDKPLLTERFAGTTTSTGDSAEGNADLKDQIKQQYWGEASQVPLQAANPYDLIYLASNVTAFSQLVSITVYDGGLELIADGDSASITALRAASISAGHYRTCLAEGLIRLGGTATKTLTADIVEGTTSADRTAAQIVLRQLQQFGIDLSEISVGSFDDLDNKNDAICYSFADDDKTAAEEIRAVLGSIGAHLLPNRNDLFEVTRFEAPTASPTLDFDINEKSISDTLQRLEGSPPSYQVALEWGRVFLPQQASQLAGAVTEEMRDYFGKAIRLSVKEDTSVKTKHLDAGIIKFETRLAYKADADDEAQRLLDLMSVERDEYSIELPLADGWSAVVGGSITLRHDRLGLSGGKAFNVMTRSDQYIKETVSFDRVWG